MSNRWWTDFSGADGFGTPGSVLCQAILWLAICCSSGSLMAEESAPASEKSAAETSGFAEKNDRYRQRPVPPSRESVDRMALSEQLSGQVSGQAVQWLEVREGEGSRRIMVLDEQERKSQPHGAVILFHDREQHPDWPGVLRELRRQLPDAGWRTISVSMPYGKAPEIPERALPGRQIDTIDVAMVQEGNPQSRLVTDDVEGEAPDSAAPEEEPATDAEEDVPDSGMEAIEGQLEVTVDVTEESDVTATQLGAGPTLIEMERNNVSRAISYAQEQGYGNLVLMGFGEGANALMQYLVDSGAAADEGLALILVDPRLSPTVQRDIPQALGAPPSIPVLDIFDGRSLEAREDARQRIWAVRRQEYPAYEQVRLNLNEGFSLPSQTMVVKRIENWLETRRPGTKSAAGAAPADAPAAPAR